MRKHPGPWKVSTRPYLTVWTRAWLLSAHTGVVQATCQLPLEGRVATGTVGEGESPLERRVATRRESRHYKPLLQVCSMLTSYVHCSAPYPIGGRVHTTQHQQQTRVAAVVRLRHRVLVLERVLEGRLTQQAQHRDGGENVVHGLVLAAQSLGVDAVHRVRHPATHQLHHRGDVHDAMAEAGGRLRQVLADDFLVDVHRRSGHEVQLSVV
eukprot:scpid87123/ scgid10439/ 